MKQLPKILLGVGVIISWSHFSPIFAASGESIDTLLGDLDKSEQAASAAPDDSTPQNTASSQSTTNSSTSPANADTSTPPSAQAIDGSSTTADPYANETKKLESQQTDPYANETKKLAGQGDTAASTAASTPSPTTKNPCDGATASDLRCASFKFDPNTFAPGSGPGYYNGDKEGTQGGNTVQMLRKVAQFLLVVVSTGAVIFITIGGFLMAISAGDSDRSTKGRTIITYNIQALVVALLAYGIIQFVIWIL